MPRVVLFLLALATLLFTIGLVAAPVRAGGFSVVPRVLPVAPETPVAPKIPAAPTRDA